MESYTGAVQTSYDAIILLEAARVGMIPTIRRRLKDNERQLIKAGDVFIWDEKEAKMRRWTDGRSWSASRVTGSFLTYREMESQTDGTSSDDRFNLSNFRYKQDGLIKQSFSITTKKGAKLHLISYTTTQDFTSSKLLNKTPSKDVAFSNLVIPKDLYPVTSHTLEVINNKSSPSSKNTSKASSPRVPSFRESLSPAALSDNEGQSPIITIDTAPSPSTGLETTRRVSPQPSLLDATPRVIITQPSPQLSINDMLQSPPPANFHLPPIHKERQETPIFPKPANHRSNSGSNYDAATLSALDRMTFKF